MDKTDHLEKHHKNDSDTSIIKTEDHHKHEHGPDHHHNHSHGHDHSHGKSSIILYSIGLILFIVSFFLESYGGLLQILTILTAGYHVILEGVTDTIESSRISGSFRPNVHILMGLAALGACLIGEYEEGALLILIFAGAHFLEEYAEGRSKREITQLMKLNPNQARIIAADGTIEIISAKELKVGDHVQVLAGDQIAGDGKIISGRASVNEATITGESLPKEKSVGEEVFASTINGNSDFVFQVTKSPEESIFSSIIKMVNEAQSNQSKTAHKIKAIEPIYVNIVLIIMVAMILFCPLVLSWSWSTSFYRAMVFLVSASPCALAASTISASLSAISNLASQGVLVKGSSYLAQLGELKAIAFDKTGTLTEGKPQVTDVEFIEGIDQDKLLDIIVRMEQASSHPLATAIVEKFGARPKPLPIRNEIGKGLVADYEGHRYRIGKPSLFKGVDQKLLDKSENLAKEGHTVVYISSDQEVVGLIGMMDIAKADTAESISYFNNAGVETVMITGDGPLTAENIAKKVQIDKVYSNVLPADKSQKVKELQDKYGVTAMVGDGVNDAPALSLADIGVGMGQGSDLAMDVADLVIMQDDLSKLAYAHALSKKMNRVIWQNIIFSMAVVLGLVCLNFLQLTDITLGVILHEGSTLVVILNGLRLLRKI